MNQLTSQQEDIRFRSVFGALRELVEQIESGNGRDDHGHPLKNPKALRDARAIVVEGKIKEAPPRSWSPLGEAPDGKLSGGGGCFAVRRQSRPPGTVKF
jgi:hypothetical protein